MMGLQSVSIWVFLLVIFACLPAIARAASGDAQGLEAAILGQEGLVGYWSLKGTLDAVKGDLKVRSAGNPVATVADGPFGEPCIDLSKKRPLIIEPAPELDRPELAIELIFKIVKPQPGSPCLFGIRGPRGVRFSLHYRLDTSALVIWNGSGVSSFNPDETLALNQWYHVALHFSAERTDVWLNGKACNTDTAPVTVSKTAGLPLVIGASTVDGTENADVLVSHLVLHSTPLTGEGQAKKMKAAGWGRKLVKTISWKTSPVSILESQIGYHPRNVKRVYLRSAHDTPPAGVFDPEFSVVHAATDETVYRGKVEGWGKKWGSQWWVLDFTPMRTPGEFYIKTGTLVSSVFKVEDGVFHKTDLNVIALDQLEHRIHKGLDDARKGLKGQYTKPGVQIYMDCGSPYAELEPVGTCVYALMDLHAKLGDRFSEIDRKRMLDLAILGADYVAACQRESDDPLKDGMFFHSLLVNTNDTWAGNIFTYLDTAYGMALMARASVFFRQIDPERSARYLAVSKKAWRLCTHRPYHTDEDFKFPKGCNAFFWNAPIGHQDAFGQSVYNILDKNWKRPKTLRTRDRLPFIQGSALLYEITREDAYLTKAIEFADAVMARQFTDWQNPIEECFGNFYEFEGDDNSFFIEFAQGGHWWEGNVEACNLEGFMHLLRLAPDHPRSAAWLNAIRTFAYGYARAATTRNPLGIYPVACYRDPQNGGLKYFQNTLMGSSCLYGFSTKNFMQLGAFLRDSRFQLNAMAGVNFIAGLNPGVPNKFEETAWDARALIAGVGRSWFGPAGDLAETARGSVPNGFCAAPQFWQHGDKDPRNFTNFISFQPDKPAGLINRGGGLQFNEGWILHSHAYVQGVAHLEAPYTLRVTTEDGGQKVEAEIEVVLKESALPHAEYRRTYRTDKTGTLVIADLPTPSEGKMHLKLNGQVVERDIAAISGGEHLYVVDFSRDVDLQVTAPEQLRSGEGGEVVLAVRNTGRNAVELELQLSAGGVTLREDRLSLSVAQGDRVVRKVPFTAGERAAPYLIRAYIRKGAPSGERTASGRIGAKGSKID